MKCCMTVSGDCVEHVLNWMSSAAGEGLPVLGARLRELAGHVLQRRQRQVQQLGQVLVVPADEGKPLPQTLHL